MTELDRIASSASLATLQNADEVVARLSVKHPGAHIRLRRLVAMKLLCDGEVPFEIQRWSGVRWTTLEKFCETNPEISDDTAYDVHVGAAEAEARRATVKARKRIRKTVEYHTWADELSELKRDYKTGAGHGCRPFTSRSTPEIDALQQLVDNAGVEPPSVMSPEEFSECRQAILHGEDSDVASAGPNDGDEQSRETVVVDRDEFELDDRYFFPDDEF